MDRPPAASPRRTRWGWPGWRAAALVAGQLLFGLALGIALARLMRRPEEQKALIGTLTTLVTWLADEAFTLPGKDTRSGRIIHAGLRMIALVGFILALQSLAVLNGWNG